MAAANNNIPHIALKNTEGRIAGLHEYVKHIREKTLLWHRIWHDCGRPRDGVVAGVMRRARASYHYVLRDIRHREDIRKERFTDAVLQN